LFIGLGAIVGTIYSYAVQAKRPPEVLAEHRADIPTIPTPPLGEMAP
jgi:hypothetical protein